MAVVDDGVNGDHPELSPNYVIINLFFYAPVSDVPQGSGVRHTIFTLTCLSKFLPWAHPEGQC